MDLDDTRTKHALVSGMEHFYSRGLTAESKSIVQSVIFSMPRSPKSDLSTMLVKAINKGNL